MSNKYADFDAKMLGVIKAKRSTYRSLCAQLESEAQALSSKPGESWRVIDRRLQALRKAGKIFFERHGNETIWFLENDAQGQPS